MEVENLLIQVNEWEEPRIKGRVAVVPEILKQYQFGQTIAVDELMVVDWLIVRLNGSEEGNSLGKYFDRQRLSSEYRSP
jgi:hypothetical protein